MFSVLYIFILKEILNQFILQNYYKFISNRCIYFYIDLYITRVRDLEIDRKEEGSHPQSNLFSIRVPKVMGEINLSES